MVGGSACMCCDIVGRLYNDVQTLTFDVNKLRKRHYTHQCLEYKFNDLFQELNVKLTKLNFNIADGVHGPKSNSTSMVKITEFVHMLKVVWKLASERLRTNARLKKCISSLDGETLFVVYLEKVMNFVHLANKKYVPNFSHSYCSTVFAHLAGELQDVVVPEMLTADKFEESLDYMTKAIPCLQALIGLVDTFVQSPHLRSVSQLVQELIDGESVDDWRAHAITNPLWIPGKLLVCLLTGEMLDGPEGALNAFREPALALPTVEHFTKRWDELVRRLLDLVLVAGSSGSSGLGEGLEDAQPVVDPSSSKGKGVLHSPWNSDKDGDGRKTRPGRWSRNRTRSSSSTGSL